VRDLKNVPECSIANASKGGSGYPWLAETLMKTFGFATGVKIISAVVGAFCLVTFAFGGPVPGAPMRTLQKKLPCWIDRDAIKNVTFCLLGAAVALRGRISHQPYEACISAGWHLARNIIHSLNKKSLHLIIFPSLSDGG